MSDEMRKAFDEWAKSIGNEVEGNQGFIYSAWSTWQAAWNHRPAVSVVSGVAVVNRWTTNGTNLWNEEGEYYRDSDHDCDVEVVVLKDLLSAQAPVSRPDVLDAIYDRVTRALADPDDGDVMALTDVCNIIEGYRLTTAQGEVKP